MKVLILGLLLTAFSTATFAQRHQGGEKMDKMVSDLNLTSDQKERMRDIKDNYRSTLQAIYRSDASKAEKKSGNEALIKSMTDDVRGVLSTDQFDQWLVMKEKKQTNRSKQMQERQEAKAELDLSDEQKTALQEIKSDQLNAMQELKERDLTRKDRQSKMSEIYTNTESQVQLVLSPEQFEKWKALAPLKGSHRKHMK